MSFLQFNAFESSSEITSEMNTTFEAKWQTRQVIYSRFSKKSAQLQEKWHSTVVEDKRITS
jgi:hypothetical protein